MTGQIFWGTLAFVSAANLGMALTVALFWLMEKGGTIIENLNAAAHRYAVRSEVVTETYYPDNMEFIRRFERPTPDRVTVAKRQAKKP